MHLMIMGIFIGRDLVVCVFYGVTVLCVFLRLQVLWVPAQLETGSRAGLVCGLLVLREERLDQRAHDLLALRLGARAACATTLI